VEPYTVIASNDELRSVADGMRASARAALDTEFLRERTYRARLCLLQLAGTDGSWLIDPLLELDLSPVAALVADPSVEIVVHAGRQDLEILSERFDIVPAGVFDVQVAAGFAGYGASLPYGRLVEAVLGKALVKGESYSDWCRRPLTGAQMRYAADDVAYLLAAADELKRQLTELGRLDWALEEMSALSDGSSYVVDLDEVWRKIGGRGSLPAGRLPLLKELARWREETAIKRDVPRGWIIKDPTLVEVARRGPRTLTALKAIRGISSSEAERSQRPLLAAIERGRNAPTIDAGQGVARPVQARARMLVGLSDAVVRARCERAGIASELVTTRAEMEAVLIDVITGELKDPSDHSKRRLLTGWRRALAGEAVIELALGRIAVKAVARPPYVEEVPIEQSSKSGETHGG